MKGIIFTSLADLVERDYGIQAWQDALDHCTPACGGAFTAGGLYPDEELLDLVSYFSRTLDLEAEFLLRYFGEFLFAELAQSHEFLVNKYNTPKDLLLAVDQEIHRDVRKLYPDTYLPSMEYFDSGEPDKLTIVYQSKRKLCALAEGLIQGAANYYKVDITLLHPRCMHRGDESCELNLQFYER